MLRRVGIGCGVAVSTIVGNHYYQYSQKYDPMKGVTTSDLDRYIHPNLSVDLQRNVGLLLANGFQRLFLLFQGDFQIHGIDELRKNIYDRDDNVPVITVGNHCSYLDGSFLANFLCQKNLLGFPVTKGSPWVSCTYHVFFGHLGTILGCLNSIPTISKNISNESMDNKIQWWSSLDLMKHILSKKRWLHLFPEGAIFQEYRRNKDGCYVNKVGNSSKPHDVCGPFQWGVAKLVCAYPETKVVCVGHAGLENIMTYVNDDSDVQWSFFQPISIRVGKSLNFADMIQQFRDEGRQDNELYVAITDIIREETMGLRKTALEDVKK